MIATADYKLMTSIKFRKSKLISFKNRTRISSISTASDLDFSTMAEPFSLNEKSLDCVDRSPRL